MERNRGQLESSSPEPDTKRRKLRKGTTSCWDCKKRKVKCTFDSTSETVCIACRRRGAPCMGQEHPEEDFQAYAENIQNPLAERLERVESLLEDLIKLGHRVEKDIGSCDGRTQPQGTSKLLTPMDHYQSRPKHSSRLPSSSNTTTTTISVTNTGL